MIKYRQGNFQICINVTLHLPHTFSFANLHIINETPFSTFYINVSVFISFFSRYNIPLYYSKSKSLFLNPCLVNIPCHNIEQQRIKSTICKKIINPSLKIEPVFPLQGSRKYVSLSLCSFKAVQCHDQSKRLLVLNTLAM